MLHAAGLRWASHGRSMNRIWSSFNPGSPARVPHRQFAISVHDGQHAAFKPLTDDDMTVFRNILGPSGVVTDASSLAAANQDWTRRFQGASKVILRPQNTQEVCDVLRHCNQRHLAVVPQAGNTGLVGGSIPVFDEVVLSTSRMDSILSFDPDSGALVAGGGCVLSTLDAHVGCQGWMMPYDFGSKRTCQIGGNVSTNAGGLRLIRYGSLHGSVLGVEVALADGRHLDLLKTCRKDNSGYDLKQLFIGAEGTLGVVTAVAIQCVPKPASVQVLMLACDSWSSVLKLLTRARTQLAEILSAFEFLDAGCMVSATQLPGVTNPLANVGPSPFYVLLETHGSNADHDTQKMDTFLQGALFSNQAQGGVLASSATQASAMWAVREGIAVSLGQQGCVYKYDVSVPQVAMYSLVERLRARLAVAGLAHQVLSVVGYGHVGDGNLHLNVVAPVFSAELEAALEPYIYEEVAALKGSISAEHGLGQLKRDAIHFSQSGCAVSLMHSLKQLMDPHGILNPHKLLPQVQGASHTTKPLH